MSRFALVAAVLAAAVPSLSAQEPGPPDTARAERLRQEIERRFEQRVRTDLALNDAQVERLRSTHQQFFPRRRAIVREQVEVRRSLQQQLRPGEPADTDSVRRLNEALTANRRRLFELELEEEKEMGLFLTPVQLVRYRQMREAFFQRVQEVQRRRGGMGGGVGRPGAPPVGQRPRRRP